MVSSPGQRSSAAHLSVALTAGSEEISAPVGAFSKFRLGVFKHIRNLCFAVKASKISSLERNSGQTESSWGGRARVGSRSHTGSSFNVELLRSAAVRGTFKPHGGDRFSSIILHSYVYTPPPRHSVAESSHVQTPPDGTVGSPSWFQFPLRGSMDTFKLEFTGSLSSSSHVPTGHFTLCLPSQAAFS